MPFIKSITISEPKFSKRIKNKSKKFTFIEKGLNIIVGENGSGKSTILNCIKQILFDRIDNTKNKIDVYNNNTGNKIYYFDSEKSPRSGGMSIENMSSLLSLYMSHGQFQRSLIGSINNFKESIVLIDEPEVAMDIYRLKECMDDIISISDSTQFIISTNHPVLMNIKMNNKKIICLGNFDVDKYIYDFKKLLE